MPWLIVMFSSPLEPVAMSILLLDCWELHRHVVLTVLESIWTRQRMWGCSTNFIKVKRENYCLIWSQVGLEPKKRCELSKMGWAWFTKDVHTNYMPECRILNDLSAGRLDSNNQVGASADEPAGIFADLNGDAIVDGADLALLLGAWN